MAPAIAAGPRPTATSIKVYKAVKRQDPDDVQFAFYDIGVGTSINQYVDPLTVLGG